MKHPWIPKLFELASRAINSATAWSFLAIALKLGGVLVLLPLVLRSLSPDHLGLWYVFQSIAGLIILLDMGFAPTATRAAAYAWVGAKDISERGLPPIHTGSRPNHKLMSIIIGAMKNYYRIITALTIVILSSFGTWWISGRINDLQNLSYLLALWMCYIAALSVSILGGLWPALLTGINGVRRAQQIQIAGFLGNYVLSCTLLLAGFGLASLVAGKATEAIILLFAGQAAFREFSLAKSLRSRWSDIHMLKRFWPLAWRTGAASLGAYLTIYFNTLIASRFLGLDVTASYGLSLQLILTLAGVSGVWVSVKLPQINQLRAQGDIASISKIFTSGLRKSYCCFLIGSLGLLFVLPHLLGLIHSKTHLVSPEFLLVMLIVFGLEMNHSLHAALVLSENENPFAIPALVSGMAIGILSFILAPLCGLWGILFAQGAVQLSYNNWWPCLRAARGLDLKFGKYCKLVILPSTQ